MYTKRDHFSDASQSNLENQIDLNTVLGQKLLESAERFLAFQEQALQTLLHEVDELAQRLLAVKSPQELASLTIDESQRSSRKGVAYGCEGASIAVGTQSELADVLGAQFSQTNYELTELIADVARSAPGGNRIINLFRILFDQASAGYEQLVQLVKQALDLLETSLLAAGKQFADASGRGTNRRVA